MESSRPSRLASCYRITVYVVDCESPHNSSQTMQQATNDVKPDGHREARGGRPAGRGVLRLLVRGARWHVEGLLHTRPEHADTRGGADRLVVSAEAPFGGYRQDTVVWRE